MFKKSWMKWAAVAAVPAMALTVLPVTGQARTTHYAAMSVTPAKAPVKTALHKKAKPTTLTHKKKLVVTHKTPHHTLVKSAKPAASKLSKVHKKTV